MSDITGEARIRVGGTGDCPRAVRAGSVPVDVLGPMADEYGHRVLAAISGASAATDLSTLVEDDPESQTTEAIQAIVT